MDRLQAFGWAGVIILSGVGPLWFRFADGRLNDAIGSIAESHPGAGRAITMVLLCDSTPTKDALSGLLAKSLIAGMPILILAMIGGLLAVFLASRLCRTVRTPGDLREL